MQNISTLVNFWIRYPALFYAVGLILGLAVNAHGSWSLFVPCAFLWIPFFAAGYRQHKRYLIPAALNISVFLAALSFGLMRLYNPVLLPKGIKGTACISVRSIKLQTSPFGTRWLYRCTINDFFPEGTPDKPLKTRLRCNIEIPDNDLIQRPSADVDYFVIGTLLRTEDGGYRLKISKNAFWNPIENSYSLAEKRYYWKKNLVNFIQTRFNNPFSGMFLAGLATGEFEQPSISKELSRFGLQHLMAISGFHFSTIAAFLGLLFQFILPRREKALCLILFLGVYAFFLGDNPSVMRTFIMCCLIYLGEIIKKQPSALNSFGIAMLGVLAIDVLHMESLSFQLSFLATAGILFGFAPLDKALETILPTRPLTEIIKMNIWNKHAYSLLLFFRKALALSLAINFFSLPMTLFYFHKYPILSLFYNLFFPFLVAISMILLITGLILYWIPYLGSSFFFVDDLFTTWSLGLIHQMPSNIDQFLRVEGFTLDILTIYFSLIIIIFILWKNRLTEEESPFQYI